MWSILKPRRSTSPISATLARRLFEQPIIHNQFLKEFVKELVLHSLWNYQWRVDDGAAQDWDLEHLDGCFLKVVCSSACQLRPTGFVGAQYPVFCIGQRPGAGSDVHQKADLYLFAWHPVPQLRRADHRDPQQWQFFLIPVRLLPEKKKTLGLRPVQKTAAHHGAGSIRYPALAETIEAWRLRLRAEGAMKFNQPITHAIGSKLVTAG
jgi:hypothetical protein